MAKKGQIQHELADFTDPETRKFFFVKRVGNEIRPDSNDPKHNFVMAYLTPEQVKISEQRERGGK
jgi:hypothetical protein